VAEQPSWQDVLDLISQLNESDYESASVQVGDVSIRLSKNDAVFDAPEHAGRVGAQPRIETGFDTPTASATQPAAAGSATQPATAGSATQPATAGSATQPAATNANVELIVTAVFAACYLLITVAWLIVALRNPLAIADPVGNAMFTVGLWAAVAAGPLVCAGIVVLAKHLSLLKQSLLFVLGILVLIPWPYLAWAS
jgi:biotin carboxyl carrier protein